MLSFLGLAYGLSQLGPKKVDNPRPVDRRENEALLQSLREQVEKTLQELQPKWSAGSWEESDLPPIEEAIDRQRKILSLSGVYASLEDTQTLEKLLTVRDRLRAEPLARASQANEEAAVRLLASSDREQALVRLREAIAQQKEIDLEYSRSPQKNPSRLIRLQKQMYDLQAEPLAREVDTLEAQATASLEANLPAEAERELQLGIKLLKVILHDHRESKYADLSRLKNLEIKLATARSWELAQAIAALQTQKDKLLDSGEYAAACRVQTELIEKLKQLNQRFPESQYAAPLKIQQAQMELKRIQLQEIQANMRSIETSLDSALRLRDPARIIQHLESLQLQWENWNRTQRGTASAKDPSLDKFAFLVRIKPQIIPLQNRVWDRLSPIPGRLNRKILNHEVDQDLFRTIMESNPSKSQSPDLPVESVTWDEAHLFCQRLGWILAHTVTLPTEQDYRTLASDVGDLEINLYAWQNQNSDGVIKPTGTLRPLPNGLFDLQGNVAEWLQDAVEADPALALVAGGNVRDNPVLLRQPYLEQKPKEERNRYRGFRCVVEISAQPPSPNP